ncbi:MAG: hypothetical protein RIF41_08470 [Polyangiaceae bacterium]
MFNATRLTTPLSALAVVVVPSILGAACAEPAPLPARRSALFRPVVEIPAALDEREKLARTDTASCGVSGPAAGRPPHARMVGSKVAVAAFDDASVALIADEDGRQLRRVSLADGSQELDPTALPGAPSAVVVSDDGRVFVTLADTHRIAVLQTGGRPEDPVRLLCTRPVAAEPVGLATYPAGLAVTSRWGHALTTLSTTDEMPAERVVEMPRNPHGVAVTDEGSAIVSHAFGGRVSRVDLATGKRSSTKLRRRERFEDMSVDSIERVGTQAFSLVPLGDGDFALPTVMVDPGDTRAIASMAYYGGSAEIPIAVPLVARVDGKRGEVYTSSPNPARGCLLPRAATHDPKRDVVLVGCTGVDEVVALGRGKSKTGVHDAAKWRVPIAGDAAGLAVDPRSDRLVVWSQFDHAVTLVSLANPEAREVVRLSPPSSLDPELALGRKLFHEAGKTRLSHDGRACATCHPDGRDDAVTWMTPKGPRQTPMLVDRLQDTAPFGWDGSRGDLHGYIRGTLRRLGGNGLSGAERSALIKYLMSLRAPRVDAPASPDHDRGAEIFASAAAGCTSCHAGDGLTDRLGHDVGSIARGDEHGEFDTPSLRHLSQSAPYYHDGRYPTLRAMLTDEHLRMGRIAHLSNDDLSALEAYLMRL